MRAVLSFIVFGVVTAQVGVRAADHPPAFWRAIAQHEYALPEGADLAALTTELEGFLASPDPELRDDIAYSTLTAWIYQKRLIAPDALRAMTRRLTANLTRGVNQAPSDAVFRRSFSALTLSVIVARDNADPFFTPDEFHELEQAALAYLAAEHDVRGFEPVKGWAHSAAHTADLIKFLARSRHVTTDEQPRILDAMTAKLTATSTVFTHGEDERLARAALSIVNRQDFDRAAFQAWATRTRPARLAETPTVAQLSAAQNAKNFLAKFEVLLSADAQPSANVQSARESVRAALKDLF